MKKVKVLAIAPYEGMKNIMENIVETRNDIELTAFTGDLDKGVEIVRGLDLNEYDALISRGGTAEMIKTVSSIPVLEIPLSHYDILSAIRLAQNYNGRFGIVGFPGISNFARMLCNILQYTIDIYTVHSKEEVIQRVNGLKDQQYSMILSDMIATTYAKSIGLNAVLITSGSESIASAFDQAVNFCKYYSKLRRENFYYRSSYELGDQSLMVFFPNGELLFSSLPSKGSSGLIGAGKRMVPMVLKEGSLRLLRRIGGQFMLVTGKKYVSHQNTYLFILLTKSGYSADAKIHGIQIKSSVDVSKQFFNLFNMNPAYRELKRQAGQYSLSDLPVLIIGEKGTGKDKMANLIYNRSPLHNNPYFILDCGVIGAKDWKSLLEDPESPFYGSGNTFYFRAVHSLSEPQRNSLFHFMEATRFLKDNRVVFSVVSEVEAAKSEPLCLYLKHKLGCLALNLPPLRQRVQDIPSLVSLYLNEINTAKGKEIIGLEPEAMALLQGFYWASNLDQFKSVLNELCAVTTTPYIKTEQVRHSLKNEKRQTGAQAVSRPFVDLRQPLDDIVFDIVNLVLAEENMNQTRAAKRLGISRTTLWRYLK